LGVFGIHIGGRSPRRPAKGAPPLAKLASVAAAFAAAAAPGEAGALPFMRLFLQGEVDTLGRGGAEPFRDMRAEALRLERPALLADERAIGLSVYLENELTLALRAGPWAGTHADDQRLGFTAAIPVGAPVGGIPVTMLLGLRRETGVTRIQSRKDGPLLSLDEEREFATVGVAARLPYGLSLGASVEPGEGGTGWLGEVRYDPAPFASTWLRRRARTGDYRVQIPDGAAKNVYSPPLTYSVGLDRGDWEIGGGLRGERAWVQGGVVTDTPWDLWAEAGGIPLEWLAVRAGVDRASERFDDRIRADGTGNIASMDLGLRNTRWFGGVDLDVGPRDDLAVRYVHSTFETWSSAEEIDTNAAKAFLHVDFDFGLFFRGGYRVQADQVAVGWGHRTVGGVDFALGAQWLRIALPPGDYSITSDALDRDLAAESTDRSQADLLGVTGSVGFAMGRFRFDAAAGQFVPLAFRQPGAPSSGEPSGPSTPSSSSGKSWLDKLAQGLRDYGGGNRLLLRITTSL